MTILSSIQWYRRPSPREMYSSQLGSPNYIIRHPPTRICRCWWVAGLLPSFCSLVLYVLLGPQSLPVRCENLNHCLSRKWRENLSDKSLLGGALVKPCSSVTERLGFKLATLYTCPEHLYTSNYVPFMENII